MLKEENSKLNWERFKCAFFYWYGDHHLGNLFTQLKMISQSGSVDDYVEEFEMLASHITGITDEQYLGMFLGGLKEEIRMDVQTLDPPNHYKAISMARNVERKLIKAGVLKAPTAARR